MLVGLFPILTVPRTLVPAVKVTVPTGLAPVEDATFAVNVTVCPTEEGFSDDDTVVVVDAGFTT